MSPTYVHKPTEVEAIQWFKHGDHPAVIYDSLRVPHPACLICKGIGDDHGLIRTLEGWVIVCPGDWIVTGTKGEHWAVKPDIFVEIYRVPYTAEE